MNTNHNSAQFSSGDQVAITIALHHPCHLDRAPLPAGATGTVIQCEAGYLALVEFEGFGAKVVPASALAVLEPSEGVRSLGDDLVCLVASQLDEVRRLQTVLSDLHCVAPPRLAATSVPVETVTLPGSSRLLADDMQREGWHRAETREDGTITWYRLRRS